MVQSMYPCNGESSPETVVKVSLKTRAGTDVGSVLEENTQAGGIPIERESLQ